MNNYVSKLFGIIFQSQQTQQVVRAPLQHLPASPEEWCVYWQTKGFPWRTEPEIDVKRQEELRKHRIIVPDIEKGIYPFKGMKLNRADVEWLLAMHDNGRGPVTWNGEEQRGREGLDLRGVDLCGTDLSHLPLAGLIGGIRRFGGSPESDAQRDSAATLLNHANLRGAHLEGALLYGAQFVHTDLSLSHLENALLGWANFRSANLAFANLERAYLNGARLEEARLDSTNMKDSYLQGVHLEGAHICKTQLENADLAWGHLIGAELRRVNLEGTNLQGIILSNEKGVGPCVVDTQWSGADLTCVRWSQIKLLGDEEEARRKEYPDGAKKKRWERAREYEEAARANRQLAIALQA